MVCKSRMARPHAATVLTVNPDLGGPQPPQPPKSASALSFTPPLADAPADVLNAKLRGVFGRVLPDHRDGRVHPVD
jgi:hypothetical protein